MTIKYNFIAILRLTQRLRECLSNAFRCSSLPPNSLNYSMRIDTIERRSIFINIFFECFPVQFQSSAFHRHSKVWVQVWIQTLNCKPWTLHSVTDFPSTLAERIAILNSPPILSISFLFCLLLIYPTYLPAHWYTRQAKAIVEREPAGQFALHHFCQFLVENKNNIYHK